MKHFAFFCFLLLASSASAQQANFKTGKAYQEAGIHSRFECTLTQLSEAGQAEAIVSKMKAHSGILKLDVLSSDASSAELVIIAARENDVRAVEEAFKAAGVNYISIDGKKYKTSGLSRVKKAK